jgi:hypothetical protein
MGSFDEFIDDIARSFENSHNQGVEGFPFHTRCRYTSLIRTLSTTIPDLVEDGLCIFPGTTEMLNFNAGLLNCIVDFQPAVVCSDGHLEYWKHGVPHADGGPAIVSLKDQLLEYWYGGHHIFTRSMLPEEVIHYTQLHLNELFFWDSYFFTELEDE